MQKDDVPAALPLIAFTAGLLVSRYALAFALIALLVLGMRRFRPALVVLLLAAGAWTGGHGAAAQEAGMRSFDALDKERFVRIVAPLDHGWSRRNGTSVIVVRRFSADGAVFDRPLRIYSRSAELSPIDDYAEIVVEGFLRTAGDGQWVASVKSPRLISYRSRLSRWNPTCWNRAAAARLERYASEHPEAVALAEALALGRSERLDDAARESYKRGGTYHLLVFSGLQIALAAAMLSFVLRWLHAPRVADWSLLVLAVLAPLFIGPTASVCRASLSIALFALSRILHRPTSLANLWCVSALLRLAIAPADLTDAAFQLTYAGSGALLFAAAPFGRGKRAWMFALAVAELSITPLTLFHFHQYAIAGSLATLILSPLIAGTLTISAITCVAPSAFLLTVLGWMDRVALTINGFSASGSGIFAAPPVAFLVAGFGGCMIAIVLLRGRWRAAAMACCFAVPLVAAVARDRAAREVERPHLIALDVGQGDALLVRSGERNLLVDGGPSASLLLPMLADRGVRRLDIVLLTHAHPDHCAGLAGVVERLDVGELWLSPRRMEGDCAVRLLEAARNREVPIHLVRSRDAATLGAMRISTLVMDEGTRHSPENNSSIVTRLQLERTRALLTGDIERDAERALLPEIGRSRILKIAHHGSRTSSGSAFLERAAPALGLISCGRHNLFGHPHSQVLGNLKAAGVRIERTDLSGTVDLELDDNRIITHREIDTPR